MKQNIILIVILIGLFVLILPPPINLIKINLLN